MSDWGLAESAVADWAYLAAEAYRREAVAARPEPDSRQPIVRLHAVTKRFGLQAAIDQISLEIERGEVLGIIGRSGAGKSTLIRCLNGLEQPDSGTVEILGQMVRGSGPEDLRRLRGRVGMIFQHFNLLSAKTVAQNVALPLKIAGLHPILRRARVAELLDLVGLEGKAQAYPAQLSGGQKQRVGIARALAAEPALLLSDEATSALDPETTASILALLRDINRRFGLTIVLITHEMSVIRAVADRVVVLDQGRIVDQGPTQQIFAKPQSPVTALMLQAAHQAEDAVPAGRLETAWRPGLHAVVRLVAIGDAARHPIVADLAAGGLLSPLVIEAHVDRVGAEPIATSVLAFPNACPDLVKTLRRLLGSKVSSFEVLGYAEHPI